SIRTRCESQRSKMLSTRAPTMQGCCRMPAMATPFKVIRGPRRAALQVMMYRTEMGEKLLKTAHEYVRLTGEAGRLPRVDVAARLEPLMETRGVSFLADRVIYPQNRTKNLDQLVDSLTRQHAAYEHLVYRPVVTAVNEEAGLVFAAIYYVLRNKGPVLEAREPTGRISKGFLLDEMTFNQATGRLTSSLVTRQMTLEERDSLLEDPAAWQPAVVEEGELVAVPNVVAGPNDYKYMGEVISQWVAMWSSGAAMDELPKLVDSNCRDHDGYGLFNKPNGIVWQGLDGARDAIMRMRKGYDARFQLLSYAVSYDHKLAFQHWRADTVERGGNKRAESIEGLGLVCFNEHLQIRDIYTFVMQDYPLRDSKLRST
ncbi:hypothetical protein Vafri_1726, partial [Volvox africanus]